MQTHVLNYLETAAASAPSKVAYTNGEYGLTFLEVQQSAKSVGTFLCRKGYANEPIVVFMGKHPDTVAAFFGVIYSGCYYVPIDDEMPSHRIALILESLNPRAVICSKDTRKVFDSYGYGQNVNLYQYDEICKTEIDEELLWQVRDKAIDIDPIYIVFTSGSTGVPKGVVACHRSVIDYIENLSAVLGFHSGTIFGNQAPLYVDACLKELYPTLKFCATTYFIPKSLFMFPVKLIDFLNEHQINTICWVVSALTMISGFGALAKKQLAHLHTIAFGSEVFPIQQFNLWRAHLPHAKFVNLYGPTEATGMSCYYEVNREFALDEVIPIGKPFKNTEILLLNDKNQRAGQNEEGEICIRGTALTLGYFNNFEKTDAVFVQNPLNPWYRDTIYRTGDIGKLNDKGELVFVSRKDYQIKHMGHRIELGEVEAVAAAQQGINQVCCVYDNTRGKIILYYVGAVACSEVSIYLRQKLPRYMVPSGIFPLSEMPLTPNGKIDRVLLKNKCISEG